MRDVYHTEKNLQVISVENVEEPWKRKVIELEIQVYDLQTELARFKKGGNTLGGVEKNRVINIY